MSSRYHTSSRGDAWSYPRPYTDASLRYATHGKVQPMAQPGWLERLLGRG